MSDRYALFGHPIGHSLSPRIHAAFAEQTGQRISYQAIDPEPDGFSAAVREFRVGGGAGFNVTVPYKIEAWRMADELGSAAQRAQAVNTVVCRDGLLHGYNTDGIGLVRDLEQNLGVELCGARILLLGAGGSAAGVLGPLLDRRPSRLLVANRTPSGAAALRDRFKGVAGLTSAGFDGIDGEFDLILNATSASLVDARPSIPRQTVTRRTLAYDLMYSTRATPFMVWAKAAGAARCVDGIGMLVEQAAEAFFLWRGVRPSSRPVIDSFGRRG